ncbi:hypothetical protein M2651_11405 [Clostridium sp. SYSU_GA19001]|uniref:hypothetical protein n=1 Tax=Clostridium caldaquaticum TaxID=2940653 RepID=UPI0020770C43|nr:hypothetical protein [Clostridium caldaquaticum]MCM8711621.1 hypothetical protein [Clostridium caldaquaticum]
MKQWKIFSLSLFIILFCSFSLVKAQPSAPSEDETSKLSIIEEKRALIKELQKKNKELEKIVEKKSSQVGDLLVKIPKITVIPQDVLENQVNGHMEIIMSHLMQISEQQKIMWKSLKSANRQIQAKKYTSGINQLNKAIKALENRYATLNELSSDLDNFLAFLNSVLQK